MPALLEENESKGFVSKGNFRNLLFIGLICMMIAMLLNSLSEEPDYILGLSIAMFFIFLYPPHRKTSSFRSRI